MKINTTSYYDVQRRTFVGNKYPNLSYPVEKEINFKLTEEKIKKLNKRINSNNDTEDIQINNTRGYIDDDAIKLKFKITQNCIKRYPIINNDIEAKLFYNENGQKILEINYLPKIINISTGSKEFSKRYRESFIGYIENNSAIGDSFIPRKIELLNKDNEKVKLSLRSAIKYHYNLDTNEAKLLQRYCAIATPKYKNTTNHPNIYIKFNDANNNIELLKLYKTDTSKKYIDQLSISSGSWAEIIFRAYKSEETKELQELFKKSDERFNNLKNTIIKSAPLILEILQSKEKSKTKTKRA